ncbi:MAG: glycoside hydrolase family 16 protein [Verrucomicrobiae bacterium]|nr:glycoside hydrolase family 16 protein [Verrucomicrobiae bacterium]
MKTTLDRQNLLLLHDDFEAPSLDTRRWGVGDWRLGSRTLLGKEPTFGRDADATFVTLSLDSHHPANPGRAFFGTEIYSRCPFRRGSGLELEARVRVRSENSGMVTSFFTYAAHAEGADEIDFEFTGDQPKNALLASTWRQWKPDRHEQHDSVHHAAEWIRVPNFDRRSWTRLKIRWLPRCTEWFVNDILVRRSSLVVPQAAMNVRANIWAAGAEWPEACDPNFCAVADPEANTTYLYDIDWIRVSTVALAASFAAEHDDRILATGGSPA